MEEFYRIIKESIIRKIKALDNYDFDTLLKEDKDFNLALGLSYMVLSYEEIITKNKAETILEKRLISNLKKEDYDYLLSTAFSSKIPIVYEPSEIDSKKLIDSIRNSFMHGVFVINLDDKKFEIRNNNYANKLNCDIPFEWFEKYLMLDVINMKKREKYVCHDIYFSEPIMNLLKRNKRTLKTEDDLEEFLLNLEFIEISFEYENPQSVIEEELQSFFGNLRQEYAKISFDVNDISDEVIEELPLLLENPNDFDRVFKEMFMKEKEKTKKAFIEQFVHKEYPNAKVTIKKLIDDEKIRLFYFRNDVNEILKTEKFVEQFWDVYSKALKVLKVSREANIKIFRQINSYLQMFNQEIPNLKDLDLEDMKRAYINGNIDMNDFKKTIHKKRSEKNLSHTYDKITLIDIEQLMEREDSEFLKQQVFKERFKNKKLGHIKKFVEKSKRHDEISNKCQKIYDKYTAKLCDLSMTSDEDFTLLLQIESLKCSYQSITKRNFLDLKLALLYILGINTYALYQNRILDEDFCLDNLEIKGYSASEYNKLTENLNIINNKLLKNENKLNKLKTQYENSGKEQIKRTIDSIESNNDDLLQKGSIITNSLEDTMELQGTKMVRCNSKEILSIIRNCFAHNGRIEYDNDFLQLIDYDDNNNLSGIVLCDYNTLIDLLAGPTLESAVVKKLK